MVTQCSQTTARKNRVIYLLRFIAVASGGYKTDFNYPGSQPGFSFRLSFFFFFFPAFSHKSPSGLYSACVTTNSCLRHVTEVVVVKSYSMISRAMKSHTNEHTVCGSLSFCRGSRVEGPMSRVEGRGYILQTSLLQRER